MVIILLQWGRQKRYYVLTDKAATQTRLAIAFGKPVQTAYTGPWVIVHEPENN